MAGLVTALLATRSLAQPADTILMNGRIATLDAGSKIAEAIAIRRDRIVAVGSSAEVRSYGGPATRSIDLGGRTVVPGLIDSHIHAIRAGLRFANEASFIGAASITEAMERLRVSAASLPDDAWIVVGGGWTPSQFVEGRRPNAAEVAAAVPGRRVFIQLFYRAVLLSEAGRRALGIAGDADLPVGAKPDRDESGETNGWINGDTAAITGLYERLPRPTLEESMLGTQRFFAELNRFGITGVIDPGGHNLAPEEYEALQRVWGSGGLTVRVAYSVSAPRPGHELADLQLLTRFVPMGVGDGMMRFNGIGERVTWGLYNNDTPSAVQKGEFEKVARWAASRGLALTAHWNNDRSVHHLLDVLERVNAETPLAALRWSIAHLHDASDISLGRMKALGVGWTMQNGLYFAAPSFIAQRDEAMRRSPPIRSALRMGVSVGGGTDAHRVQGYNPFVSLKWMIDGRTVGGLPTRGSAELATREEALRIYTQGSAWFAFAEDQRGTLEPGKLADLAVLDRDYFTVPLGEMASLRSVLTMVGGKVVHAGDPFRRSD